MKLAEAKLQVEGRTESLVERQRELICQRLLQAMDKETQAEIADNAWLKKEVCSICSWNCGMRVWNSRSSLSRMPDSFIIRSW